jgi:protein TonB
MPRAQTLAGGTRPAPAQQRPLGPPAGGLPVALVLLVPSVGLHLVAFLALALLHWDDPIQPLKSELSFQVEAPPLEEPPPPEDVPPPPVLPAAPPPPVHRRVLPPDAPPPPPAQETPVAFDNVTITSDDATGFTIEASSGISREGPIGPPGQVTGRRVDGVQGGQVGGQAPPTPRIFDAADLSHATVPPGNLDELLTHNYPRAALEEGIEGVVHVRAVVGPDGRVSQIQVLDDPGHGFAEACRRTLQSSHWPAPVDHQGTAVSQRIRFDCTFEISGF